MKKITNEKSITKAFVMKYGRRPNIIMIAKMTGMSKQQLHAIDRDPNSNVTKNKMNSIFKATRDLYGDGLAPWEYLNDCNWCAKGSTTNTHINLVKLALEKIEESEIAQDIIKDKQELEEKKDSSVNVNDIINLI